MTQLRACVLAAMCAAAPAAPLLAQDGDRIWGRVHTVTGDVHEGFLRWDRNEGSWVDVLDGSKPVPEENYRVWLAASGAEPAVRTIELRGYRITWDEDDPDFPSLSASGIRFGHLSALEVVGRDRALLALRSGETVALEGGSTDLGPSLRDLVVDVPGGSGIELEWEELDRVEFSAPPTGARASSRRLHGTVEDVGGRRFTGYVSWDLDEILETDVLDGEEMDGRDDRRVRFSEIASIAPIRRGARVVLRSGATLDLTGTNDVDDGNRGVQISDPDLGMVEVEWPALRVLRLHDPERATTYDAFDGGRPLRGTVTTRSGDRLEGLLRWDADEGATWELLDGRSGGVRFAIELGRVAAIERGEASGATVTLLDGRSLALGDASDVNWDNHGIMVAPEGSDPAEASSWRLIPWDDFETVRFASEAPEGRSEGS